jgi:hypothetical protein
MVSDEEPPTKKTKTESGNEEDEEDEDQFSSLSLSEKQTRVKEAFSNGPDADDFFETMEMLDELPDAEKSEIISNIATIENTEAMLTTWGSDPVNDPTDFRGISLLNELPKEIVAHHAEAMLKHIDSDVCEDEKYGFHESYHYLWQQCVAGVVQKCPDQLAAYIKDTMIPRLQAGEEGESKVDAEGVDKVDEEGEDSDVCEVAGESEVDEEGGAKPSIEQDDMIYLEAVRLGVIAEEGPGLLAIHSEQLKKKFGEHWSDIMKVKARLYTSALEALAKAVKFD